MLCVDPDATVQAGVLVLIMHERYRSVSKDAWHETLKGYGYGVRQTGTGVVITTLSHGVGICRFPVGFSV
ncbi:hypothetical protein O4H61_10435 [Roseovarius aestuarii]|nr:hypothetical protein [Roseovarius aestuarii]